MVTGFVGVLGVFGNKRIFFFFFEVVTLEVDLFFNLSSRKSERFK